MSTKNTPEPSAHRGATGTLKLLANRHYKKLIFTFLLVVAENITYLMYPILAGVSINAILSGEALNAVLYGVMILFIWSLGAARRSVDTRTFARIYAALAVSVVMTQRKNDLNHSTIAARVVLSREYVDFFELHLPMFITSLVSMIGAAVMLLIIEVWAGIACLLILAFLALFLPGFARKNEALFHKVNNRLEKEVNYVARATVLSLNRHYSTLAQLRIRLSDREAVGYLIIGILVAVLFSLTIIWMTSSGSVTAGHIYSVMTYMWMFATSLDDGPQLLEKYSQLKDIGKRVSTDTNAEE